MKPITDVTVALLAGGQSRRMKKEKSLAPLAGKPLIRHVLERVQLLGLPIILITNQPDIHQQLALPMFGDVIDHKGSLIGLHSALYHSRTTYTLCIGCDMPLVNVDLLAYLVSLRGDFDAVVPRIGANTEPLHALYHRNSLPTVEMQIEHQEFRISKLLDHLHVRHVPEDTLKRFDPSLRSFTNVNTPAELAELEKELSSR